MTKTRKEARQDGDTLFNTGKPCRNGHMAPRYTSTGGCTECLRVSNTGQSILNQSLRRKRNADNFKDGDAYTNNFPIEWHDTLNRLRNVVLFGTDENKELVRSIITHAAAQPYALTSLPPVLYPKELTRVDLDRYFTFENNHATNLADFDLIEQTPGDDAYIYLNKNWYLLNDIALVHQGANHKAFPSVPPQHRLPLTMKGIIK